MFRFRLEFLLRYRRQLEEMAMYELANRIREANQVRANLEQIKTRSSELVSAVRRRAAELIPAPVYTLYKDYLEDLRRLNQATLRKLSQAEVQVEEQRQRLLEASVKRKMMARFKEMQGEAYEEAEGRRQQKVLDELVTLKAGRRRE